MSQGQESLPAVLKPAACSASLTTKPPFYQLPSLDFATKQENQHFFGECRHMFSLGLRDRLLCPFCYLIECCPVLRLNFWTFTPQWAFTLGKGRVSFRFPARDWTASDLSKSAWLSVNAVLDGRCRSWPQWRTPGPLPPSALLPGPTLMPWTAALIAELILWLSGSSWAETRLNMCPLLIVVQKDWLALGTVSLLSARYPSLQEETSAALGCDHVNLLWPMTWEWKWLPLVCTWSLVPLATRQQRCR